MPGVATSTGQRAASPAVVVGARDEARLRRHAGLASRRARRTQAVLATITVPLAADVDVMATVALGRSRHEPWFSMEQPDRAGRALAGVGVAVALEASGPERLASIDERWSALASTAVSDPGTVPGSGPVAVGGLAFADDGGRSAPWDGFAPASLHVPRVGLARAAGRAEATLAVLVRPADDPERLVDDLLDRVRRLERAEAPLLDPDVVQRPRVASALPPEHYEAAVGRAGEAIRAGELEKIVLAREVVVRGAVPRPAAVLGVLREAFPSCFTFAVGRGPRTFLAASPELLVRREGQRVATLALAGSTRRSADPAVDDHLGERLLRSSKDREEHAIVARRILRRLGPHTVWVTAAEEPVVVRMANIQHLATPIRGQLHGAPTLLQLAGVLHPTPAVGGQPSAVALPRIPALEAMDRGWYAGPVGWTDAAGDGELCVALRCALLDHDPARAEPEARLQAGVGVVGESDPASELAETETKLQALLPVLSG